MVIDWIMAPKLDEWYPGIAVVIRKAPVVRLRQMTGGYFHVKSSGMPEYPGFWEIVE
jgi:hypothetical protein